MLSLSKYFILSILLFHINCSIFKKNKINIYPNSLSGSIIYFSELDKQYKRQNSFNKSWSKLTSKRYKPYHRFRNKQYVVSGHYQYLNKYYIIIEDVRGRMFKKKINSVIDSIITLPSYIFFKETKNQAEELIGNSIWLNNPDDKINFYRVSDYNFKRFEKVFVLGIIDFQNNDNDFPLWLRVESKTGELGFVRFNGEEGRTGFKDHYFTTNPIPSEWGKEMIKQILARKTKIGMTKKQVSVAIGNPFKINITSSRHGISEQWVYKNKYDEIIYYQFDDETLTYTSK